MAPAATNTPVVTSSGATATPTEEVAGDVTPGARLTPVAPDAGTGFSFGGGHDGLTLVGLFMVLVSLGVLLPSGLSGVRDAQMRSAERRLARYLDGMEEEGRHASSKRDRM